MCSVAARHKILKGGVYPPTPFLIVINCLPKFHNILIIITIISGYATEHDAQAHICTPLTIPYIYINNRKRENRSRSAQLTIFLILWTVHELW